MPNNCPAALYYFRHHHFTGFVHPVNINIKIIVDNITCRRNKHRSQYKKAKNRGCEFFTKTIICLGQNWQYNSIVNRACVRAINTRLGHRISRKKEPANFIYCLKTSKLRLLKKILQVLILIWNRDCSAKLPGLILALKKDFKKVNERVF